uniref:Uncharacterized protein n=1 Tax=Branchiostoma floridae TaxID=7739 RepID=C3YYV0_BRAFL|eukprot:XP_002598446.1 hypothetical protein BRAFLDRAFT_83262 [Branchiostoma floridae]
MGPDREPAVALLGVTGLDSGLMIDLLSVLELDNDRDLEELEELRERPRRGVAGLDSGLVGGVLPVLPKRNALDPVDWLDIVVTRVPLDDLLPDEDALELVDWLDMVVTRVLLDDLLLDEDVI